MDIALQPEIEQMVLDRVRSGEYSSTSELLNVAVRNFLEGGHSSEQSAKEYDPTSIQVARDASANLAWLNSNGERYVGEWGALYKGRLLAHGRDGLEVFRAAKDQGINLPLMHRIVPEEPASWGGW